MMGGTTYDSVICFGSQDERWQCMKPDYLLLDWVDYWNLTLCTVHL